ncbi:MAG: peptidase U32 family protein [Wolinella sp.]
MLKKAELLSPAGNLEKLKIAIQYGADAVYGGVSHFSLRNRAGKEFDFESFREGIEYAHERGKRVYVTINGFPFNSQLKLLERHIAQMAELKPDAFIIAAPGVIKLSKRVAPQIPIHVSTQANILNVLDAEVFYDMGVKRIVAARELSLKDAKEIKRALPDLEIEIFIHGSMCFAFSGRCLISALQHGRVPNRGSCANDCRFDYEYYVKNPDTGVMLRLEEEEGVGTHIFNAKDLNLSSHIAEILETGAISALKIEGRTKSNYYAGITTRAYRAAIDDFYAGKFNSDLYGEELNTLKNRGFTDGYLIHRPFQRLDTQNHQTAISDGSFQVSGEVHDDGLTFFCKFTTRIDEEHEIIAPQNSQITPTSSEIGEILKRDGRFFVKFKKIVTESGKELDSVHSGNTNAIRLPGYLPPFSFLRIKEEV